MQKSKWDTVQEIFIMILYIILLYLLVAAVTKTRLEKVTEGGDYGVKVITID